MQTPSEAAWSRTGTTYWTSNNERTRGRVPKRIAITTPAQGSTVRGANRPERRIDSTSETVDVLDGQYTFTRHRYWSSNALAIGAAAQTANKASAQCSTADAAPRAI